MATQEKIDTIAEFKEHFQKAQIAIATRYIGINAEQATNLRKKLRDENVVFKVYKNTLIKRALEELEMAGAVQFLEGPTAWAFSEDPVAPAKVLKEFSKDVPVVSMGGGVLEGKTISEDELTALAELPSQEELIAQVVGTIAAPLRNLVSVINAPLRDFATVIEQIRKQKEEAGEAA